MARWRDAYESFARDQYADTLAWTLLLIDDEERARAALDGAVARELSRSHAPSDPSELRTAVRTRIVRAVMAGPGAGADAAADTASAPAPVAADLAPLDASIFAPPTAASDPRPPASALPASPAGDDNAVLADASARRSAAGRVTVRAALVELSPVMRALIVLHHHDGLSVAEAAGVAGLSAVEATDLLRAGGGALERRTGVAVPPIADAVEGDRTQVSVAIEEWA